MLQTFDVITRPDDGPPRLAALREAMMQEKKTERPEPEHEPGSMDRMDYLTGLWQQGLISDRDFDKEKRHFE